MRVSMPDVGGLSSSGWVAPTVDHSSVNGIEAEKRK
jgi:hypothetical protein